MLTALLVFLNFLTSAMTAVLGIGGGIILIAFFPLLLPAAAIIPIHAVTQLSSNLSRAWFGRKQVVITPLREYLLGVILGVAGGFFLIGSIDLANVPLFIGAYILLNLWLPAFQKAIARIEHFSLIGFVQSVLSLFVGITGPIHLPLLMKRYDDHHAVVSTGAAMIVFAHLGKIVVYSWHGFAWLEYAWLLAALVVAAVAGSWLGVRLRHAIRIGFLRPLLKYLLTLLALHMIVRHLYS